MNTDKILILARKHLGKGQMQTSARVCLEDAIMWHNDGMDELCRYRALKSLKYSVGLFHPDFKRASK